MNYPFNGNNSKLRLRMSFHVDFNTFKPACMTWITHHNQTYAHTNPDIESGRGKRRKEKSRSGDSSSFQVEELKIIGLNKQLPYGACK